MRGLTILLLTGLLFSSCGNKNKAPNGVLAPDKMEAVLWDVIRADAFTTDFIKKDSSKNAVEENAKLQKKVFVLHGVTRESFYKSFDYYKANSEQFKSMLDSMIVRANRDRNQRLLKSPESKSHE